AARMFDRDRGGAVGDQRGVGGRVGVDAQQGEGPRAGRRLVPGQVRVAVAAEAAGRAQRESGRDRLAVLEAVAVDAHWGTPRGKEQGTVCRFRASRYTRRMRSLFRLLPPVRVAKAPALQRDSVSFVLADGRRVDLLRVRDPRARRIRLSVDERGGRLTLPLRASLVSGDRFLHEHRDWLTHQLAAQSAHAGDGLQRDATASLPLRGVELPLRWEGGRASRLAPDGDGLRFVAPASAGDAALQRALRDFYEAQGRADVGRWLPKYLAGLPRPPRRIVFRRTSTQWGSLAPDGTVSLDLALVLARPAA